MNFKDKIISDEKGNRRLEMESDTTNQWDKTEKYKEDMRSFEDDKRSFKDEMSDFGDDKKSFDDNKRQNKLLRLEFKNCNPNNNTRSTNEKEKKTNKRRELLIRIVFLTIKISFETKGDRSI